MALDWADIVMHLPSLRHQVPLTYVGSPSKAWLAFCTSDETCAESLPTPVTDSADRYASAAFASRSKAARRQYSRSRYCSSSSAILASRSICAACSLAAASAKAVTRAVWVNWKLTIRWCFKCWCRLGRVIACLDCIVQAACRMACSMICLACRMSSLPGHPAGPRRVLAATDPAHHVTFQVHHAPLPRTVLHQAHCRTAGIHAAVRVQRHLLEGHDIAIDYPVHQGSSPWNLECLLLRNSRR